MTQREERLIDVVVYVTERLESVIDPFCNACSKSLRGKLEEYATEISDTVLGGDLDFRDGSEGKDEEERSYDREE